MRHGWRITWRGANRQRFAYGATMLRRTLVASALAAPGAAHAQGSAWPDRPITMTVGFLAGGSADIAARIMAERMPAHLPSPGGQAARILVDNRTGAGGAVAAAWVKRQPADGYTVMMATASSHGSVPATQPDTTPYDPIADFTAIARVGSGPFLIVVPRNSPHQTIQGLFDWLRANPGRASWATSGTGGIAHLAGEYALLSAGNLRAEHVPYRGGAAVMEALAKGEVDFSVEVMASTVTHLREGLSRGLAVTARDRHRLAPEIPTLHEVGLTDFDMGTWNLLFGPRDLPAPVTAALNRAVTACLAEDAVRTRLTQAGVDPAPSTTPDEAAAFLAAELAKFRDIVRRANIRLR